MRKLAQQGGLATALGERESGALLPLSEIRSSNELEDECIESTLGQASCLRYPATITQRRARQCPLRGYQAMFHGSAQPNSMNSSGLSDHIPLLAASDIRNLVETINNLPRGYQGTCDILLNEPETISANRNLVILYILMTAGPSIEETAELVLHLMYSSRLTPNMAAYLRRCTHAIYGDSARSGEMNFQRTFSTRGRGRLYTAQPVVSIKRPIEMFLSRYELSRAMRRMKDALNDALRVDQRHKFLAGLEPPHRLSHVYFWKTGVLAPFSLNINEFSQPNRSVSCTASKVRYSL